MSAIFAFRSFRTRLLVFLLALLGPVLGVIFYYVNANNTEYTEETINRYLELGADVFDYTRQQQVNTLQAIISSLTWDFGFRSAYAANDPATLYDAALNVLDRSMRSADSLMIVAMSGDVVIDTSLQGFAELPGQWQQLLDEADASSQREAETIVTIDGQPFQLIALPLYLPRQVAWIIGGFALDAAFVERVEETIVSEVSIVRVSSEMASDVIASTLGQDQQNELLAQLQVSPDSLSTIQRIRYADEEFSTLLRRLTGPEYSEEQTYAVIQRSYDENNVNVVQFQRLLLEFYLLVLVVSLIAVMLLARSFSRPIMRLAKVVSRIEQGDYQIKARVTSADEVGQLATSVNSMATGLAEKEKVRDLLGKVVSPQIAEELLSHPVELGGEEREVTILFADIRGFTSYCESLPPAEVLQELNKVLSVISNIVEDEQGVVDKYLGDAVMALFGAPIAGAKDADNAMAAALRIIAALESLNSALAACVGVHTGTVVAGNLGSSNRLNYSVIGDSVNLAARLESLTRYYNVSNIVSAASRAAAPDFLYREIDKVMVAGRKQPVQIFELLARQSEATPDEIAEVDAFSAALTAYRAQDWVAAKSRFSDLQRTCDNRALCQIFLDRIEQFQEQPPESSWQGVFMFDKK